MNYTKNKNKNKNKNKRIYFNKQTKKRNQNKERNQNKKRNQKNIKLIIKDLGKKTKKYKRIQYGCNKSMKGGGPLLQPFTYIGQLIENSGTNLYNNYYGYDRHKYTIY